MARPGIEPGTRGFSVLCSTDWAIEPQQFNYIHNIILCQSFYILLINNFYVIFYLITNINILYKVYFGGNIENFIFFSTYFNYYLYVSLLWKKINSS